MNKSPHRLLKIALSISVAVGALAFLRYSARGHTSRYKMVDEVTRSYEQWTGAPLQVHGWVEPGSIDERIVDQETIRSFTLEARGQRLVVHHRGPKPDSFRDGSEVVAEGRLVVEAGVPRLEATGLMAKCPSKYHGAPRDKLFDRDP